MSFTCPKCHYRRRPTDVHVIAGLCPACGIAYGKWQNKLDKGEINQASTAASTVAPSLRRRFFNAVFYLPARIDPVALWARAILLLLFLLWGLWFIVGGVSWERIGGSFLHSINLPFHEFGHVLFGPFGRFMAILGGSLFQVLLPLVFTVAFVWKRDNFAAAITLWWCGQNFIDVSPYIADAPYRAIPLVGGMSEDYHDWGNLLTMMNAVDEASAIAASSFVIGTVLMFVSYAWAFRMLYLQGLYLQTQTMGP